MAFLIGDRVSYVGAAFPGAVARGTEGQIDEVRRHGDYDSFGVTFSNGVHAWLRDSDLAYAPSRIEAMVEALNAVAEDAPKINFTTAAGLEGFCSVVHRLRGLALRFQSPDAASLVDGVSGLLREVDEMEAVALVQLVNDDGVFEGPYVEVDLSTSNLTVTYL